MDPRTLDALLRQDLASFVHKTFATVRPGDPFRRNWHVEAMAWHLQQVVEGQIRRLVITVPPRNLKSICASVALPAWLLGRDPSREVICASYGEVHSVDLHNKCRLVMEAPWYRRLYPATAISARKNTETEIKTTQGGGRIATSVEGVMTGRGANLIIIDDPIKPTDAMSQAVLARVREWFDGTVFTRLNDKVEGAIVLVMQRLHEEDLAGHLLGRGGWVHLNLPAIAEAEERIAIGPGRWHRRRVGDLLHSEREPQKTLDELKATLGSRAFAAQYQQQHVPLDGGLLKWSWFRTYEGPPARHPDDQIIQSWDTASKASELNDYSVCTTWLIRDGAYHLLDVLRDRLEYPSLKRRAIDMAQTWRPHAVLIEDKGSGTHLLQELRLEGSIAVIGMLPQGDKVVRASTHAALIEGGRVHLPQTASWLLDFQAEILAFPNGRHDDQVDSLSQFLAWAYDDEYNAPRIRFLD